MGLFNFMFGDTMTIEDLENEIDKEEKDKEEKDETELKLKLQRMADIITDNIENGKYNFDIDCDDYSLTMLGNKDYMISPLDIKEIYYEGLITKRTLKYLLCFKDNYYILTEILNNYKTTLKRKNSEMATISIAKISKDDAKVIIRSI